MTEDDVVEDRLGDAESLKDLGVDVAALHAQRRHLPVRLTSSDARVQRLHRDVLGLLRRLHAAGD